MSQFHLSASTIQAIGAAVPMEEMEPEVLVEQLWDTCRLQARPRLDNLAQRIVPRATWEDLVLPERECSSTAGDCGPGATTGDGV